MMNNPDSVPDIPPAVQPALTLAASLLAQAGSDTPRLDAELLLAHVLRKERTWLYTYPTAPLTGRQRAGFLRLLRRRLRREPMAYILHRREFFGLTLRLNRRVLVPRPETELLVETALEIAGKRAWPSPRVVDVGTGSGCIAVALATRLPGARLAAVDRSAAALKVARYNAAACGAVDRVHFWQGHLAQALTGPVDMLVSNPPYVARPALDAGNLSPEVTRHEPRLALDGGPDGLEVIRELLAQARRLLGADGAVVVEIGADQGEAARQLGQAAFPQAVVEIRRDLAGLDRLLVIQQVK